jgi:hypothetical protein
MNVLSWPIIEVNNKNNKLLVDVMDRINLMQLKLEEHWMVI